MIKKSGGVIVAGTDTSIGKTLVSSWITIQLNKNKISACPFKPYESGEVSDIKTILKNLKSCAIKFNKKDICKFNLYHFKEEVSPHLAAKDSENNIDIKKILKTYTELKKDFSSIVFEPAGGLLVPINEKELQITLLKKLKLPVILVARPGLGTINHTLLSIKCLESYNIKLLGIIFCNGSNKENQAAIEKFSKYKILATIPHFKTEKEKIAYLSSEIL